MPSDEMKQRLPVRASKDGGRRLLRLSALGLVAVVAATILLRQTATVREQHADVQSRITPDITALRNNQDWVVELTLHGRLPIVIGPHGRSDPFQPGTVSPDTPESRDAIRVRDILSLSRALAWYFADVGRYPVAENLLLGEDQARCLTSAGWLSGGGCAAAPRRYLSPVPRDPGQGQYRYTSDGSFYTINVALEVASGILSSWEYRVSNRERR